MYVYQRKKIGRTGDKNREGHRRTGNFCQRSGGGELFLQMNSRKLSRFLRNICKEKRVIYDALT